MLNVYHVRYSKRNVMGELEIRSEYYVSDNIIKVIDKLQEKIVKEIFEVSAVESMPIQQFIP